MRRKLSRVAAVLEIFQGLLQGLLQGPCSLLGGTIRTYRDFRRTPPPCNSGIIGIYEDPNIILIIHSHYYWWGVHLIGTIQGLYKVMGLGSCLAVPLNYSLEIKVQGASLNPKPYTLNPKPGLGF